jgi:type II secretory pathway component PulJ
MKKLVAIVLLAILGAVLFGVLEQHENVERQNRERAERTLDECWRNAAANGGVGVSVCKDLADRLNK